MNVRGQWFETCVLLFFFYFLINFCFYVSFHLFIIIIIIFFLYALFIIIFPLLVRGAPVAQWVKRWPTDLADRVRSSLKVKSSQP